MWYDLAVAAILLFCMIRGAKKGFLWQLAAIAAVVLCFAFAETVSVALAPYLNINPPLNRWVSMLLLYIACSFLCFAVARGLQNGLERAKFEDYDRHLGGLFGLLKGAGLAVILTFFAVTLSERLRPTVLSSYSGHAAAVVMHKLSPVFPEELGKVLKPYMDKFEGFEEGFSGTHLVDGTDDPGDLFGDGDGFNDGDGFDNGPAWDDGFEDWDDTPAAGGRDEPDEFALPGPVVRGTSEGETRPRTDGAGGFDTDPFGWGSEPRPSGERVSGTPVSGAGQGFGDDPGSAEDWLKDGRLNTDRLRDEAGQTARSLWDDVPAETKQNLTDGVRRRAGDEIGRRFDDFLGPPPTRAGAPDTEPRRTRQDLIAEIASVYNPDENVQQMIRRQSARALGPVPEEAAIDVLRDWLADLRGAPDPDPGTTKATTLRERIARRLTARTARPGEPPPRR